MITKPCVCCYYLLSSSCKVATKVHSIQDIGTCNYEMTNTRNEYKVNQANFEIYVTHFVVSCSPDPRKPTQRIKLLQKIMASIKTSTSNRMLRLSFVPSCNVGTEDHGIPEKPTHRIGCCYYLLQSSCNVGTEDHGIQKNQHIESDVATIFCPILQSCYHCGEQNRRTFSPR